MGKHQHKKEHINSEEKDEIKLSEEAKNTSPNASSSNSESSGENNASSVGGAGGTSSTEKKEDVFCEEKAKKEIEKWKGEYLRKMADFENYRKRMIKEKQEAIDYANETLLQDLIHVLDDFDRAIDAINTYCDEKTRSYMEGFAIIQKQFYSMLENKYSLSYYKSEGERFDPNIHDAKASRESAEVTEEIVEKELLKGYRLHGRVIRTAQVETIKPKKQN